MFASVAGAPAGMHVLPHALWQQRCLEVARLHHVGVVDKTRRTYRHHGRQRDASRRIASSRHATLRVAPHRYATLEPLGKPGGSRAFSADGPPQAPVAPRRSCNCCQTTGLNRRAVGAYSRPNTDPLSWREKVIPDLAGWSMFWRDGSSQGFRHRTTGRRVDHQTFRGLAGEN